MADWIPWLKDYEVNVREIDEQHRELFLRLNELMDAVWDGKSKDAMKGLFEFTSNYAATHFAEEEGYMQGYGFPGYIGHKELHDEFKARLGDFLQEFEEKEVTTEMVVSVITALGDWTREHVRAVDKELGKFLSIKMQQKR